MIRPIAREPTNKPITMTDDVKGTTAKRVYSTNLFQEEKAGCPAALGAAPARHYIRKMGAQPTQDTATTSSSRLTHLHGQ